MSSVCPLVCTSVCVCVRLSNLLSSIGESYPDAFVKEIMLTPDTVRDTVSEFQKSPVEDDVEFGTLQLEKQRLESLLLRKKYLVKRLQLLYQQLDKTRNYQEFVDVLMNSKALLREVFTLEDQTRRTYLGEVEVDWSRFCIDGNEYIGQNDQLIALQNAGFL